MDEFGGTVSKCFSNMASIFSEISLDYGFGFVRGLVDSLWASQLGRLWVGV